VGRDSLPIPENALGDPDQGHSLLGVPGGASRTPFAPIVTVARFISAPQPASCAWALLAFPADQSTDFSGQPRHPDRARRLLHKGPAITCPGYCPGCWRIDPEVFRSTSACPGESPFRPLPNIPCRHNSHPCLPADPVRAKPAHAASRDRPMWSLLSARWCRKMPAGTFLIRLAGGGFNERGNCMQRPGSNSIRRWYLN